MSTTRKTPKLRFPEFTDDWEQRKLNELAEFNPKCNLPNSFEYVDLESVVGTEMISSRYEIKENAPSRAQRLAKKGDVFYQTVRPYQRNNYLFDKEENNYVFSTGYAQLRPNCNSRYLLNLLQTDSFVNIVLNNCTGTSYPAINSSDLGNIYVTTTKNIREQTKIGEIFYRLDNLITHHQRQCEALKKQKQFFLQNMFPKEGESEPRIRFNGFTEPWEQRKFKDFTKQTGIRNKENLDLEPYSITNETGFVPQKDAHDEFGYMKNTDRSAYSIVSPNSFAYNPARINVGSIGYYKGDKNVIVSSLYEVFQTDKDIDDSFLWIWFKSSNFFNWINKLQEGSVRQYFYYDKLCECKLPVPSLKEQEKIGTFFSKLDNLITLHQRQYEQLVSLKKYLLSKMFI